MDQYVAAIILGIVEGLTEFLPISSTGHLILVNRFVDFTGGFAETFDIVIQVGAILSVIVFFRHRLWPAGGWGTEEGRAVLDLWKKTIAGVVPALIIGGLLGKHIQKLLFNPLTVALALLAGGIILILIERRHKTASINTISRMSYRTAFCIGLIQCLAMIPGTSRSAATIIGAMLLGASRVVAAEFSFFLAIPTLIAASCYALIKHPVSFGGDQFLLLSVGFVVSFLVALVVIAGLMRYITRRDFQPFGYYRIVLGVLVLTWFFFF
jgi:undecaprenyl-diphosphatase